MFEMPQLISEATGVTLNSNFLIDHILSNTCDKICQSGAIGILLSDHFTTYFTRKVIRDLINRHYTATIRTIKQYSKDDFYLKSGKHKLGECLIVLYCVSGWDNFKSIFHSVLDVVALLKEVQ